MTMPTLGVIAYWNNCTFISFKIFRRISIILQIKMYNKNLITNFYLLKLFSFNYFLSHNKFLITEIIFIYFCDI